MVNPASFASYLGRKILTLFAFQSWPLSLFELREALAVNFRRSDLSMITRYSGKTIFDSNEDNVRLVQYTAEQYFRKNRRELFPNTALEITDSI